MGSHTQTSTHTRDHSYHLVDPSPWPVVASAFALLLAGGAVMAMHGQAYGPAVLTAGLLGILYVLYAWWSDVIREAEHEGHHTPVVQLHLRYGMILFIASEVMFFVAWFWAYFDAWIFAADRPAIGSVWPPEGTEVFDPWDLPFLNTVVLLLSGVTVTWAHHALQNDDRKGMLRGLALTILLGLSFTALQGYEYSHAAFSFDANIYSSAFYMATGFHGVHVIVGTLFLTVCWFRARAGHFRPDHHFGFEAAAWYWHFVDVVWLFLFIVIYWLSSGQAV